MNYVTLASEVTGYVVIDAAVHEATIAGIEINGDDTRLVVITND
jgi:hypothetical protein